MRAEAVPGPAISKRARRIGIGLGVFAILQMLLSIGAKVVRPPGVPEHFVALGWRLGSVPVLAVIEIVCTVLYVVPRTAPWGAILLTGYLGGAAATHLRVGDGQFYLRDPRLRAFVLNRG